MNKEMILSRMHKELHAKFGVRASVSFSADDDLYYVNVYNLDLKNFSAVSDFLADFSLENYDGLQTYLVPVMFTPEQTVLAYPQYATALEVIPVSTGNWHNQNNESSSCDDMSEEEFRAYALAA